METRNIQEALTMMGGSDIMKPLASQEAIEVIPTGIHALDDDVMGIGGLPMGRVVHLYAETTVGKSTLAQWLTGQAQKQGFYGVWGDAEETIQKAYAAGSGMDLEKTFLIDWATGPDLLFKMRQAIATNGFSIGVIDSLDAVRPVRDANKEMSAHDRFQHPKLLNDFFYDIQGGYTIKDADGKAIKNPYEVPMYDEKGKLTYRDDIHRLADKNMCLIVISHKKTKITIGFGGGFGPKTRTSGGSEKDFAASIQLDLIHTGFKKGKSKGERILKWREVKVKADKNKLAVPQRECILRVMPDGHVIPDDEEVYDVTEMGRDEAVAAGLARPVEDTIEEVDDLATKLREFKKQKDSNAELESSS